MIADLTLEYTELEKGLPVHYQNRDELKLQLEEFKSRIKPLEKEIEGETVKLKDIEHEIKSLGL